MKNTKQEVKKAVEKTGENIQKTKGQEFSKITNKALKQSGLVKDIIGVTDGSIEEIYGQAYLLYNTGKYKDSSELFRLLMMLNSLEPKYVMGLAACMHMMKEYESAAATYTLVSILDATTPIPHFHASDCYIQIGDKASAIIALELAVQKASDKPQFATLKERAQITIKALKKELEALVQKRKNP